MERPRRNTPATRQLSRYTMALAAIADVWFVVLWSRHTSVERRWADAALTDAPNWLVLLGSSAMALGMVVFGITLNDLLDLRRDRSLHPDRPIAAGRIAAELGLIVALLAALAGILGAVTLGRHAVVLCVLTLIGILVYNGSARFIPSFGPVALGLVYAAHMLAANPSLRFLLPVWFIMTHTLIVDALAYRIARRRPLLTRRRIAIAGVGWVFWSLVLGALAVQRAHATGSASRFSALWPAGLDLATIVPPLAVAIGFAVFAAGQFAKPFDRARVADKFKRYGSIWNCLYAVAWLAGAGYWKPAAIVGALTIAGVAGMIALREITGLREHPVGYRL